MQHFHSAKIIVVIAATLLLNILITYISFRFFDAQRNIVIQNDTEFQQDIALQEGTIIIGKNATVRGDITLAEGTVLLDENTTILGNVTVQNGQLKIKKGSQIKGNVALDKGTIRLEEGSVIEGNLKLENGQMEKHSTAAVLKEKPDIFITYDYPKALAYFDVLPEEHKEAIGYIFLTKNFNTSIREDTVQKPEDYFEGIYFYQDKKLQRISPDQPEAEKFFKRAQKFFKDLPERRLGPFSVGATTKNYAHNPKKADIYVPIENSYYTFIHEVGHVMDFKENFSDYHTPKYPFISAEVAVSSYGGTHPGEDFAEAYKHYIISSQYFKDLIAESPERQAKYDFLRQYVFHEKEYKS